MPAAITHSEDRAARVRHEDESRNGERGPEKSLTPAADPAQRPVQSRKRDERTGDARYHERDEARPEQLQEERLEVWSEGTEPVDDVPVQQLAAGQGVRVHPLRSGIDDRIRPLPQRNQKERGGGGEDRGETGDAGERDPPRSGRRAQGF